MPSTSGVNLAISGLASGLNWQTLIQQLAQAERAPETQWTNTQSKVNSTNSAFTIIKSYLSQFQTVVNNLKDPTLYQNRSASSSTTSVATASSSAGGTTGTFAFNISQLATAASLNGAGNISSYISPNGNVSSVTVGAANFATAVTAGNFTVNGAQVAIATTDSLQAVFNKIATATNNAVTASYDKTTDKITLSSSSAITLGSAADTSNFLQVAKLYNNNSGAITSSDKLGRVSTNSALNSADLATPITSDGSFTINGVTINYSASKDTIQSVLQNINSSAAGVNASYDTTNNRFVLANNTTGDVGIALKDVTGNFLAATGLTGAASGGTVTLGNSSTDTVQNGAGGTGSFISPDGNVAGVTLASANFAKPVTAGNFTVNGAPVSIATSDTLQNVFDKIAAATSNAVTASYDSTTDKITLSSASPITLGSSGDTSNFLSVAQLAANGTGTVASSRQLGRVNTSALLNNADLKTAISGPGSFAINGVKFNYDPASDTVQSVLDDITNSSAGVTASYDSTNNRFVLTNKTAGATGITLSDVSGNFLAATGLAGTTLTRGTNLLYTVNGGSTLQSQSNTIDSTSSGISGLSVTALTAGSTAITVGNDTSAITANLQNFVTYYNDVQSYIDTNAATSTNSSGKVTPGTLTGDMEAAQLTTDLRSAIFSPVSISGLSSNLSQLASLGFTSNGYNNTISLDSSTLNSALSGNLSDVQKLFTDPANGLAGKLNTYLTNTIGDSGTLTNHQTALTKQSTSIDTQIANLEKQITADSAYWTTEFQDMETAQSQINQELTTLNQQISNGTL